MMKKQVLVTVGSQAPFDDLVERMDSLALFERGHIDVTAQIGNGTYIPKNMKWFRFYPELEYLIRGYDLIICHHGVGTILESLKHKKPVIAIQNPNAVKNTDIIQKLSPGHIYSYELDDLGNPSLSSMCDQPLLPFEFPHFDFRAIDGCIPDCSSVMFHLGTGGHTRQMLSLAHMFRGRNIRASWCITKGDITDLDSLPINGIKYKLNHARMHQDGTAASAFKTFRATGQALYILKRDMPDFVISAGPGNAVPLAIASKMVGAKFIYIEDQSRIFNMSETGKLMKKIDPYRFFVQWQEMADKTGYRNVGLIP